MLYSPFTINFVQKETMKEFYMGHKLQKFLVQDVDFRKPIQVSLL